MRVTTAFNRLLAIPGASVTGIRFEQDAVVVCLRRRSRRLVCPRCGCIGQAGYDRRRRRWRHLDLGRVRCLLECELRRFPCRGCERIVSEGVPWARPGARFTRAFEDVVAWLAQQAAFSVIVRLMRLSWRSVGRIVRRVVGERLPRLRLRELRRIGIDEVSYRRGHRYLTLVCDHHSRAIVWAGQGRSARTLERFFDELGPDAAKLEVVSLDLYPHYRRTVEARAPQARLCFDPFHVVALANFALDTVRRQEWQALRRSGVAARWLKQTRWSVLKRPERLSEQQSQTLAVLQRENARLYRAYLLKEQLRALYQAAPRDAAVLLDAWLAWASRSKLRPFVRLARMLRRHKTGILAAIELNLSNSRLEALNNKVRLISHRSFGFHSADPLIALIYLCCGAVTVTLPT